MGFVLTGSGRFTGLTDAPGSYLGAANQIVSVNASADGLSFIDRDDLRTGQFTVTSFIDFDEVATPANPAANVGRLYVKDSSGTTTLFFRDNAGTETDLLAGGGASFLTEPTSSNDGAFYFFGGNESNGDWKINRYPSNDVTTKESATEAANPSFTDLTTAFANRATLVYS